MVSQKQGMPTIFETLTRRYSLLSLATVFLFLSNCPHFLVLYPFLANPLQHKQVPLSLLLVVGFFSFLDPLLCRMNMIAQEFRDSYHVLLTQHNTNPTTPLTTTPHVPNKKRRWQRF